MSPPTSVNPPPSHLSPVYPFTHSPEHLLIHHIHLHFSFQKKFTKFFLHVLHQLLLWDMMQSLGCMLIFSSCLVSATSQRVKLNNALLI